MLILEQSELVTTDLPWYIISPNSKFNKIQNTQIQIMTWTTVIVTPLLIVFEMMDKQLPAGVQETNLNDQLMWLVWLNDFSWIIEIILNFFTATPDKRTFSEISKAYIKGAFFFDLAATIPPMILLQKNSTVNLLKFFRFVHFFEMFTPIMTLLDCVMSDSIARKRSDIFQLIVLFTTSLLFGHIAACIWIAIGTNEGGWLRAL